MKKEVTTTELLEAISAFAEDITHQIGDIKQELAQCAKKEDLKGFATKEDIAAIRKEMATKEDIAAIRKEMATKEDLRQEISKVISLFSPMIYNANRKVNALLERLISKRVLARADVTDLLEMHP